jgi:hypothetical protein
MDTPDPGRRCIFSVTTFEQYPADHPPTGAPP